MKVVLDTDVMVAALQSDAGASRALLLAALDRSYQLLLSTTLMIEYEAVLTRSSTLTQARLTTGAVYHLLDELAGLCVPVGLDYRWRPAAQDPDDDLVLETAVNGVADYIATFNLKHLAAPAAQFGVPCLRPADVLRRIRE
ncbi:putative toxin-antitoxin system toxin component, PIN family [Nitrospirillum viridazoti CBAmc]|uniref:Putative toxin-antitoxin system toxin component, PIN family n=1 Tax=Nitrospirillum viridazoti CBAmc TaxID=1441467 RepID=A0A248K3Q2_9PROT|nr:putative toxin-antitoxin system toxin component, PIN family [Nitrospirillum amazonense CBAmc]